MTKEKFFPSNTALFTLISACLIVAIFMGLRMVFGLFTDFFVEDLQCTVTQFGLAIGIQMLMWGMFAPIFGALADKIGSAKVTGAAGRRCLLNGFTGGRYGQASHRTWMM